MSEEKEKQFEKEQRDYWDESAPLWEKWQSVDRETLKPAGEAIMFEARLRPDHRVLDLATGAGEPGLTVARHVRDGTVVGVDISEAMVRIASAQARAEGLSNYTAQVADVSVLPFADKSFDAVICRMGIMFFPNPRKAFSEMIRVLRPGGRLALAVWSLPKRNPWVSVIGSTVNRVLGLEPPKHDEPGMFRFANPSELLDWASELGLVDVIRQEVEGEMKFESAENYWEVMGELALGVHRAVKDLPLQRREEVKKAVVDSVSEYFLSGSLHLGTSAWLIAGTKGE